MSARRHDDSNALTVGAAVDGAARATKGSVPSAGKSVTAVRSVAAGPSPQEAPEMDKGSGTGSGASVKTSRWFRPTVVNVKLIYAGYLASLAMPFLAILAALFAYQSAKQNPPPWLATHYTYQMRTFWIGLGANLVAWALSFLGVGLLLFPLIAVWLVARSVKGLIRIARQHEIEDPNSYFV